MTCEMAMYFSILMRCGYTEDFDAYLEQALTEEEPLSDVILELAFCGNDRNRILSVLYAQIDRMKDNEIAYDIVSRQIREFLWKKYSGGMAIGDLTEVMHDIASKVGDRIYDEPWDCMDRMWWFYSLVEDGLWEEADFRSKFDAFLSDGVCFDEHDMPKIGSNTPIHERKASVKRYLRTIWGKK